MPLPITQKQAYTVAEWIKSNFRSAIDKAVKGTPFSTDILCGIACQETRVLLASIAETSLCEGNSRPVCA
jgi:hypothetical protein